MKYKLIKEYPGSPELGTEVEKRDSDTYVSSTYLIFRNDNIENMPEYWEKVSDDIWWGVWKRDYIQSGAELFKAWIPYKIECIPVVWSSERQYFKTKEEAEQYIIKHKPCLTLTEVSLILGGLEKKRDIFLELRKIVKSRL